MARKKKGQFKRFNDAVIRWRWLLWLNSYDITVRTADESRDKAKNTEEKHGETSEFAIFGTTETLPDYQTAIIEVVERELKGKTEDELDSIACHEMVHVLMAPFSDVTWEMLHEMPPEKREVYKIWRRKAQEELTSRLTSILTALHRSPKRQSSN